MKCYLLFVVLLVSLASCAQAERLVGHQSDIDYVIGYETLGNDWYQETFSLNGINELLIDSDDQRGVIDARYVNTPESINIDVLDFRAKNGIDVGLQVFVQNIVDVPTLIHLTAEVITPVGYDAFDQVLANNTGVGYPLYREDGVLTQGDTEWRYFYEFEALLPVGLTSIEWWLNNRTGEPITASLTATFSTPTSVPEPKAIALVGLVLVMCAFRALARTAPLGQP